MDFGYFKIKELTIEAYLDEDTIFFYMILVIVLLLSCNTTPCDANKKHYLFKNDAQILGEWVTIDYVSTESEFSILKKNYDGDISSYRLVFKEGGKNQLG